MRLFTYSIPALLCLFTSCASQSGAPPQSATQAARATPASIAPSPAVAPPSVPPSRTDVESVTLDFPSGSSALTAPALSRLDGAARLYRDAKPELMLVTGHADRSGAEFPNLLLSARRAEAVKQALVDRGIPADRLQILADGEAQPTPGLVPGRTAVITWR